ncbi:MAG TPA: hypothetical protein VLE99_00250 [Candidatus Saccharimonadales bacterium]|nr:hypothetical protein [Candidatus Saccharimonadales bacterium]
MKVAPDLAPGRLDIAAEVALLTEGDPARQITLRDAQDTIRQIADSGMPLGEPDPDGPLDYLPFATVLRADPRKWDTDWGLRRLGLVVVTTEFFDGLQKEDRRPYAAALLNYSGQIGGRPGIVRVPHQLTSDVLSGRYPEVDDEWVEQYALELKALRIVFGASELLRRARAVRASSGERGIVDRHSLRQKYGKASVEVHWADTANHELVIKKFKRGTPEWAKAYGESGQVAA